MNVKIEDMARLIADDLKEYSDEVRETVEQVIDKTAEDALNAVANSPAIQHMKKYKRSFFIQNEYKAGGKYKGSYKLRVCSKQYRIAHLIEKGHAKRNGGRTRAYSHWINGQKVADTLPERIKEALER